MLKPFIKRLIMLVLGGAEKEVILGRLLGSKTTREEGGKRKKGTLY